jgi:hypothetical protein
LLCPPYNAAAPVIPTKTGQMPLLGEALEGKHKKSSPRL